MAVAKPTDDMSLKLLKVADRAKRDPQGRILSLARLIDVPALRRAFGRIRKGGVLSAGRWREQGAVRAESGG